MTQVTSILSEIQAGDVSAAEKLLPLVYDELRKRAAIMLATWKPGQTLQATALVHEAYLRLVDAQNQQNWDSRGHFFIAASIAMERILIESARYKKTLKRGGKRKRVDLDEQWTFDPDCPDDLIDFAEALNRLAAEKPEAAKLVKLRVYGGLPHQEACEALGLSRSTGDKIWATSRAWLYSELCQ